MPLLLGRQETAEQGMDSGVSATVLRVTQGEPSCWPVASRPWSAPTLESSPSHPEELGGCQVSHPSSVRTLMSQRLPNILPWEGSDTAVDRGPARIPGSTQHKHF